MMVNTLHELMRRAEGWSQSAQDELLRIGLEIEAAQGRTFQPGADELAAIDEGLAQLDTGDTASDEEIRKAFRRFGKK